ncbi:hypothetical protein GCM10027031_00410 [Corynebacterium atrinae]
MTTGASKLGEHAHELGYQLRLLAEDPSLYSDLDGVDVVAFPTRDDTALRDYVRGSATSSVASSARQTPGV